MNGHQLAEHRKRKSLTQVEAAKALGVSQTYLSLLEARQRPLTQKLRNKAASVFNLPPTEVRATFDVRPVSDDQLAAELATLGYKGFSHLRKARRRNPADILLSALNARKRDARLVEALPWIVLNFIEIDRPGLYRAAKSYDLQNRLGYLTTVAKHVAEHRGDNDLAKILGHHENELMRSLLVHEDTLCNETMTEAERKWLRTHRPKDAKRWRILTDLTAESLDFYE